MAADTQLVPAPATATALGDPSERTPRHPSTLLTKPRAGAALPWWWVTGYGLLWAVGIGFVWWPLTLLRLATSGRFSRLGASFVLVLTPVFLTLSLVRAVPHGAGASRVAAAAFLLTPWLALVLSSCQRWVEHDLRALARGLLGLAAFQGAITVAAVLAHHAGQSWRLPFGMLLPDTVTHTAPLDAWLVERVAFFDYYNGLVVRSSGLFGNPTWAGALAGIAILVLVLRWSWFTGRARWTVIFPLTGGCLASYSLYHSYSRNSVLGLTLGLVLAALCAVFIRLPRKAAAAFACLVMAVGAATVLLVDLGAWFAKFNAERIGSLESRRAIYEQTLVQIHSHNMLIGSGIKEQGNELAASLGTHSTLLGLVYRGGWVAFWGFVLFLLVLLWQSFRRRSTLALALVAFSALYAFGEDLDAGHFAPLALVLALATLAVAGPQTRPDADVVLAKAMIQAHASRRPLVATWVNHSSGLALLKSRQELLDRFDLIGIDGIGLRWLIDQQMPRTSADLVLPHVLPALTSARVALVGGTPEGLTARREAVERLLDGHSTVVTAVDGYGGLPGVRDVDGALRGVSEVNSWLQETQPDFVLVGLGAYRQEIYAKLLADRLPHAVVATCGGFMDQLAQGAYYPVWAYPLRLNWFVRLIREPRRLWRRYTRQGLLALRYRRSLQTLLLGRRGYADCRALVNPERAVVAPAVPDVRA